MKHFRAVGGEGMGFVIAQFVEKRFGGFIRIGGW
jgi:hypothetical protein